MTEDKKPAYLWLRELCEPPDFEAFSIPADVRRAFAVAMLDYIYKDAAGMWGDQDSDGHSNPERLVVEIGTRMSALCDFYNGTVGSPIEGQLAAALLWLKMDWAYFPRIDEFGAFDNSSPFEPLGGLEFFITPQAKVGEYSVDLAVWFRIGKLRAGLCIECDGHEFHERTKEQASRDKRRDREILSAGWPVLRFTGSEIFRDPVACVAQIRDPLYSVLERISKDGGLF